MGIDLQCEDKNFGCSYNTWNNIRVNIIDATFDYIFDKILNDSQESTNYSVFELKQLKSVTEKMGKYGYSMLINNKVDVFISLLSNDYNNINTFIYFNLGGLYELCNKSDSEGYYTCSNSLDICQLFDIINPYMKNYFGYEYIYRDTEESIRGIFEESINKKSIIYIR